MNEKVEHIVSTDSEGNNLSGGKQYKLKLPSGIPASGFWSVIVYNSRTNLIISSGQPWPSVHSNSNGLIINHDGSVDVWFGPEAPAGKEKNWIKTVPRQNWFIILRLYGTLEPWFDKTWRPGEIEEVR